MHMHVELQGEQQMPLDPLTFFESLICIVYSFLMHGT